MTDTLTLINAKKLFLKNLYILLYEELEKGETLYPIPAQRMYWKYTEKEIYGRDIKTKMLDLVEESIDYSVTGGRIISFFNKKESTKLQEILKKLDVIEKKESKLKKIPYTIDWVTAKSQKVNKEKTLLNIDKILEKTKRAEFTFFFQHLFISALGLITLARPIRNNKLEKKVNLEIKKIAESFKNDKKEMYDFLTFVQEALLQKNKPIENFKIESVNFLDEFLLEQFKNSKIDIKGILIEAQKDLLDKKIDNKLLNNTKKTLKI